MYADHNQTREASIKYVNPTLQNRISPMSQAKQVIN